MKSKLSKTTIAFWSILFVTAAFRIIVIYSKYNTINSDNGILGIMAMHILKGKFPLFFYGQHYMGSPEAFVIAIFFLIFGTSVNTMTLAMAFVSILVVISAYFLGRELRNKKVGLYAMLLTAIPPAYVFWHGMAAYGGYPETILFGNILLTLALKTVKTKDTSKKAKYYMLLGLISGLALWTHLLIIYYIAPVAIFLLVNENKKFLFLRAPFTALPALLLGGLPLWIYNFSHKFATFTFPPTDKFLASLEHMPQVMYRLLFCGYPKPMIFLALCIYAISFLNLAANLTRYHTYKKTCFLFLLFFLSIAYFFSENHLALDASPRYLMPLLTLTTVSAAYFSFSLSKFSKFLGILPIITILTGNSIALYKSYIYDRAESKNVSEIISDLVSFLDKNGLHENYSAYNVMHQLNFLTMEDITVSDYFNERYAPYEEILENADNPSFIETNCNLEPVFNMFCSNYDRSKIQDYYIYYNLAPKKYFGCMIPPSNWKADSNYNNKDASFAFDRDIDTYWGTKAPQKKGMWFLLDMGASYNIFKIAMLNRFHDDNYPYEIRVEISEDGNNWKPLDIAKNPETIFLSGPRIYRHFADGRIEFMFTPAKCRYIKINQDAGGTLHPWEMNEIFVWEYKAERAINITEAKEISDFLMQINAGFVYADFWLSAKIRDFSKNKIKTLRPINVCRLNNKCTSRLIKLDKCTAFVIDNENTSEFEKTAFSLGIKIQKQFFQNFTCYWLTDIPETPYLSYWSGYGLLKTNRTSPTNASKIIQNKIEVIFKGEIKLLGYNIETGNGTLSIDYFWQLKYFPRNIFVFVYFMRDNKIVFQNDHPLLEQFPFAGIISEDEIFKESYKLENLPSGTYEICLGLCVPKDNNRRIEILYPKHAKSKTALGEITI